MTEAEKIKETLEKAILIGRFHQLQKKEITDKYLDELEFLASTLKINSVCRFTQSLELPDKKFFLGKGKLEEVKAYIEGFEIDVIIFDDDLSPSQVRNLERELNIKIYDRSLLILDIFLFRAKTAQAKTQVELARSQYLLPRLTRMWTHLERQRGGTNTRGGAGEKEIETDRRIIKDNITKLKKKLQKIESQSETQRKNRHGMVRISLAGYTNVGKSTLMNILSNANVSAENKLFATVDATVRKINLKGIPGLISDTVGFIRKLPTNLIESFKSTLSEVKESDIIAHVIDISNPNFEDQLDVVEDILKEINASCRHTIYIFNKIDALKISDENSSFTSKKDYLSALSERFTDPIHSCVFISAISQEGIEDLKDVMHKVASTIYYELSLIHI